MSVYEYSYTSMNGQMMPLSAYRGKVLLLVNTASQCGFTSQYEGLEALYERYHDKGLEIIGFPCDQFGGQEPDGDEGIQEFCRVRYGVTFPLSKKIEVNGEKAIEIYKYLTGHVKYEGFGDDRLEDLLKSKMGINFDDDSIKWNFTKFLVDKEGKILRFEPPVTPEQLVQHIEKALKS